MFQSVKLKICVKCPSANIQAKSVETSMHSHKSIRVGFTEFLFILIQSCLTLAELVEM